MENNIQKILRNTWHRQSAENSLQRWHEVCEQHGWGNVPKDMPLLAQVFGASWYFTRYVFYRGVDVVSLIDQAVLPQFSRREVDAYLEGCLSETDLEDQMDRLINLKNEVMLQILLTYLSGSREQEQVESALTNLAEACLRILMIMFKLDGPDQNTSIAVLGMGRMAGYEMTFGSDLDLIFLYQADSDEESIGLSRQIRLLLRNIASVRPAGSLYEVDMRLRPHGTAGALITSTSSFLEYHGAERDIWERQLMTRCRPVFDTGEIGRSAMEQIQSNIYAEYDDGFLRKEIRAMRDRVENELGCPRGKFELKRGKGGIMDIDFITHYLQLLHGYQFENLRTCSTRDALRKLKSQDLIGEETERKLQDAYNFLKKVELSLRLFDLKSVSAFPKEATANQALVRAMGYENAGGQEFIEQYVTVTDMVREEFLSIVCP